MTSICPTYGDKVRQPPHRSFFRDGVLRRAPPVRPGEDPAQEYLIDQANARGFLGAYSDRPLCAIVDPELTLEEILVGLLMPQSPAEGRVLKLVVRILQSPRIDIDRLLLLARRERAITVLHWLVDHLPEETRTEPVLALATKLAGTAVRGYRAPDIRYDWQRLVRRAGRPR